MEEQNYENSINYAIKSIKNNGAFLTSGNKNKANTMTISWAGIGHLWKKDIFIIVISNIRYTKEFIDSENTFTISIPNGENMKAELDFCGHNSGRNINKEEAVHIKFLDSKMVDSPIVDGCNMYYECKVVFKQNMDVTKVDKDIIQNVEEAEHTMYFGEIVDSYCLK